MSYWSNVNVAGWPAGEFTEPASATKRTTTYWDDVADRAYLMYMAEQVLVPGWEYGGVVTFQTYPYAYTATGDITNALNWEASGHSSSWKSYYYGDYGIGSLSQAQLNSDVMSDVYGDGQGDGVPVIVVTNTGYNGTYLTSWNKENIIHAIAIIGYDNNAGTYTYVETCGGPPNPPQGGTCGSIGQGIYTIPQSQLYYLMQNAISNGSLSARLSGDIQMGIT